MSDYYLRPDGTRKTQAERLGVQTIQPTRPSHGDRSRIASAERQGRETAERLTPKPKQSDNPYTRLIAEADQKRGAAPPDARYKRLKRWEKEWNQQHQQEQEQKAKTEAIENLPEMVTAREHHAAWVKNATAWGYDPADIAFASGMLAACNGDPSHYFDKVAELNETYYQKEQERKAQLLNEATPIQSAIAEQDAKVRAMEAAQSGATG